MTYTIATPNQLTQPNEALAALPITLTPDDEHLDNIKAQLDLVLLALESIAPITSDAMLQSASQLGLEALVADRVSLWRLRQSNPLRKGQNGRKKLDVEEARALTLISCHLAQQHHDEIRHAIALLEVLTEQNRAPHQEPILGDYLDKFQNTYQDRMDEEETPTPDTLTHLALKLLIDLLFYSSNQGSRRLWSALLDRTLTVV
jgi:Protein of unknown function (DUF3038)